MLKIKIKRKKKILASEKVLRVSTIYKHTQKLNNMENTYSVRFCKGYSCPDRIDSMVISYKRLFVYKHATISHNRFFQIRFLP